jgi:hypothetical protein
MVESNKPTDQSLARLTVPGWLVVMILSPLVGMVVALWLDSPSGTSSFAWIIGPAVSVAGTSIGAMLAKGSVRVRILRGIGGAALGVCGFALAFLGAIALTILAKGRRCPRMATGRNPSGTVGHGPPYISAAPAIFGQRPKGL